MEEFPMSRSIRSERIEARIAPDILVTVRQAAEMQGRSLSEFVVAAAEQVARQTIEELQIVRLSADDQHRFIESLFDEDAQPAPAMTRAAGRHQRLIGEP